MACRCRSGECDPECDGPTLRAEIERLQDDLAQERRGNFSQQERIAELQAGMREYACTASDHPCGCYNQFLSERAEIERLKLEWKVSDGGHKRTMAELNEAHAEVERLTAALSWIGDHDPQIVEAAREKFALAGKEGVIQSVKP
jgi:hypothetical protein